MSNTLYTKVMKIKQIIKSPTQTVTVKVGDFCDKSGGDV